MKNCSLFFKEKLNDTMERLEASSNEGAIYRRQLDTVKVEVNSLNHQLKFKEEECQTLKNDLQSNPENNVDFEEKIKILKEKVSFLIFFYKYLNI